MSSRGRPDSVESPGSLCRLVEQRKSGTPPHQEQEQEDLRDAEGGCDTDDESPESESDSDSEDEDDAPESSRSREPRERCRRKRTGCADLSCTRCLWAAGARCIVFDFTFGYVWSRFLACATFMLVVITFAERSFDDVLLLPSSGRCEQARAVVPCLQNGSLHDTDPTWFFQLPVDPFEGESLHINQPGLRVLLLAAWVSMVNSRYLAKSRCLAFVLVPWAVWCSTVFTYDRFHDLFYCRSGRGSVDWRPYTPGGRASWTLPGPTSGEIEIAEYCSVMHDEEIPLRTTLGNSVKDVWAAWMGAAEFEVRMGNVSELEQYCGKVGLLLQNCMQWLNSSALGNSLDCKYTGPDLADILRGLDLAGFDLADVLKDLHLRGPDLAQILQALALVQSGEPTVGDALGKTSLQCVARVSGANFRLGHSAGNASTVAFHLLSLASRGVRCPAAWGLDGQGPEQARGSTEQCLFAPDLVRVDLGGPGGSRLRPLNESEAYLQEDFFRCVVDGVSDCSMRMMAAGRTTFRTVSTAICGFVVLCGLVWALYLRYSTLPWQPWSEVPEKAAHALRVFLSSRVMWGFSVALLLQLGFFVMELEAWPLVAEELPKFGLFALLGVLFRVAFWLQTLIVLAAIALNVAQYFRLRRQIMELPSSVFFGEDPAPADYHGPDLNDLKEMGSSSVLYAMYFPGILFWRLFFGSWILALMLALVVGFFMMALVPSWHGGYSKTVWRWLSSMLFVLSILLAHYLVRLYMQRCLMRQDAWGMRLRCACLFAWWELLTCFLGLALGPFTTLYDFLKSLIATTLSSLIVQKPNFIQFGELSDYVYCTYCASLYLERVAEDQCAPSEESDEEGVTLAEPGYQHECPARCCGCVLIFIGVPSVTSLLLNLISVQYDYPCSNSVHFMPHWFCKSFFTDGPE